MSPRTHIPVLGIVGGIGSGKSAVSRWLTANHNDVLLINGDEIGHEVLTRPVVQDAIRGRFGDQVFDSNGQINRKALGQVVFGSRSDQRAARRDLEGIVHPQIRETIVEQIVDASAGGQRAVLLDAAVLFEAGWNDLCDAVAYIDVPRDMRLVRLCETRGWNDAEVDSRESSQASLESKRSRSQFVVDNSGSVERAGQQLEEILMQICASLQSNRAHS